MVRLHPEETKGDISPCKLINIIRTFRLYQRVANSFFLKKKSIELVNGEMNHLGRLRFLKLLGIFLKKQNGRKIITLILFIVYLNFLFILQSA